MSRIDLGPVLESLRTQPTPASVGFALGSHLEVEMDAPLAAALRQTLADALAALPAGARARILAERESETCSVMLRMEEPGALAQAPRVAWQGLLAHGQGSFQSGAQGFTIRLRRA